ncbi:MAG: hypothetical protein AB9M60_04085 [Leptothrix sp. (in: b-proteobacteria)]
MHQPIRLPTTGTPPQQLTSFWMKTRHCVAAGKQAGGGVPGVVGALVPTATATKMAITTATINTMMMTATPRCA